MLGRVALLAIYLPIFALGLMLGIRDARKKMKMEIVLLTPRNVLWRAGLLTMTVGSGIGVLAVFLGIRYGHSVERAMWVPVYAAILAFIVFIALTVVFSLGRKLVKGKVKKDS